MKNLLVVIILLFIDCSIFSQSYPFQNVKLDDEKRLENLISLMTMEEKINCLSPFISIPRLGIRGTRIVEGLHGLALSGPANWAVKGKGEAPTTTFPQAYGLGETWDPELITKLASLEAEECRFLTQNKKYASAGLIVLAPNADLGRDIRWGRTEECYGEDPYLTSRLTVAFVKGLQGDHPKYWKTASLMKHFLANSNENNRTINSSDFDDRLFYEYYSYGFYKGVTEGGARAYMAAYNKYNGIPCTVHPVLKDVTVKQWGQNGIISTDGGAFRLLVDAHKYYPNLVEAASACIHSGITMFLDNYREPLQQAVNQKMITEEEINQAIRSNLRVILKLGLLDNSPENPYSAIGISDTLEPWLKPESRDLAFKAAVKSVVLLKNSNHLLPLNADSIKTIAVIGPSANHVIPDWYGGKQPYTVSVLKGITNEAKNKFEVLFAQTNKADSAVIAASKADVAIVCIGNHPLGYNAPWGVNYVPGEGREEVDRQSLTIEQEDLVKLVYAANPNTILVLVSSFPYAINWSNEHIPAILHITQSGQESGNAIAHVVFGKTSPAGRLTQTWSSSIDELLPILDYNIRHGRTYLYDKHIPLFPFGYGLSYSRFEYSNLKVSREPIRNGETAQVSFTVKNTGNYDSDEVAQLYVSYQNSKIERPIKELKGFKRIFIPKGQSVEVTIPLKSEDLKYWDTATQSFVLEKGTVSFFVGGSSADIRIKGEIKVD